MEHAMICEAAICAGDTNPNFKKEIIWYPGEPVCQKRPYQKFQKKQALINRYYARDKFKYSGYYWTAEMLDNRVRVMNAKGKSPER